MAAEREIKTTLAIDGEKAFKAAMDDAFRGLKVLGSEMKLNTAIFGDNASSMEGLTKKGDILNKQITQQKEIVAALSKAVEDSAAAYGENDKRTDQYRIRLNNASTALTKMEGDLGKNNEAIDNFGKKTDDAEKKTNKWHEGLKKIAETLGKGLVTAAKATAAAIGTVAVAAGKAAISLGKEVVKSFGELEQNLGGSEAVFGKYAESIQKTGEQAYKNLGVSQSDYLATANKMGALFQGSGVQQQKSLELTEKAMQRAADMASVMGIDMQVALDSVAGAAKGNFTMMDNLGVAMNATTIEAFAAGKGLDFVWKSASNADKAEVAMQMFFEKTEQYAGNFAREAEHTISGSMGMLKASVSSFVAGLGNANADMSVLTGNMVTSFQAVVNNIVPIIQNIVTALPTVVGTLAESIGGLLPVFLETATTLFTQVLETLMALLPTLIPVAMDAINTIIDALMANLPAIINAAMQLITALANGLIGALPQLTAAAVMLLTQFVQYILINLPMLITAAIDMIVALVDGISSAIPQLIPAAVQGIETFATALINNLPKLIDSGMKLLLALTKGLVNAIPQLINALPKVIEAIITFVVANIDKIIQAGIQILVALIGGIIQAIPQLVASIPKIISAIVSGLMNGISQIGSVGTSIVQGIWQGISNGATWLWNQISSFASNIVSKFKSFLGIHSPSRVLAAEIGKPMGQGVAVGIKAAADEVDKAMESIVPDASQINAIVDVERRYSGVVNNSSVGNTLKRQNNQMDNNQRSGEGVPVVLNIDGKTFARLLFPYADAEQAAKWQRNLAVNPA